MKYFFVAGEASGDLHGANLIKSLTKLDPEAQFAFWGGDNMIEATGTQPGKHIKELAFMGFVEVLANLPTIIKNFKICKNHISQFEPDVIVFIDYPGFNLRMTKWAKKKGYKTAYYISPQIWAWKENRVKTIKKYVDEMVCILPFEKDFYAKHGFKAHYVGHPLLDAIQDQKISLEEKEGIALLPGSRKQEIQKMLPTMLKVANEFGNYEFKIAGAPAIEQEFYHSFTLPKNVRIQYNAAQTIMRTSKAALVTSGTATLETALFETPLIVCYKASALSVAIARKLIKVKYISLVNLIAQKQLVKELIQNDFNASTCTKELRQILNEENWQRMIQKFKALKQLLGGKGASDRAAYIIYNSAQKQ